ncbi:MAG: hypothetical protein VB034_07785 [Eubacteriales bacterium]|nr:hypothetical protein [Eubacteriales bacterium]
MKPYEEWQKLVETERQPAEHEAFWNAYFAKETEAYRAILSEKTGKLSGTQAELAARYDMSNIEFAGFLDGINTSLTAEADLENLTDETALLCKLILKSCFIICIKQKQTGCIRSRSGSRS